MSSRSRSVTRPLSIRLAVSDGIAYALATVAAVLVVVYALF